MGDALPRSQVAPAYFSVAALILLTGSGGSCSEGRHATTTPPTVQEAELPAPDLRLLVLTDVSGYLEPCGCTSRPLGGIDRMAARARAIRRPNVPSLMVAAGDLFFQGTAHGDAEQRAEGQERMTARTLAEILDRIELTAAAPGPRDFSYGADAFVELARAVRFPLLAGGVHFVPEGGTRGAADVEEAPSSNDDAMGNPAPAEGAEPPTGGPGDQGLRDDLVLGDQVLGATASIPAGGLQIGLLGLVDLHQPDGSLPARVEVRRELLDAGRDAVRRLRADGAQVIIALVSADRRTARQLARGIDGIDFLVHGGLDEAEVDPPSTTGGAVIVHAGRQGQGLVVLDLYFRDGEGWTDASVWTRQVRRAHLEGQIDQLRGRISAWEEDPSVNEADLARQRGRLAELEAEQRSLLAPPPLEGRDVFTARYEELAPDADRDRSVSRLMAQLDRRVNEHNRQHFADWEPEPAPEGQPRYVGSAACGSCHGAALRWWRGTPHGRAYTTLVERHKNYNLSCVGCHVTGYLEPGGSTVTHVDRLQDVGCETCHGPGSMHIAAPTDAPVNVRRDPAESLCRRCHNQEHSDAFDFQAYRRLLVAPGHGQPVSPE